MRTGRISSFLARLCTRSNIVSGVFLFAFLNGVSEIVFRSIHTNGVAGASAATFGVSVIVYVGFILALQNLSSSTDTAIQSSGLKLLAIPVCLVSIPSPYFSWIAIALVALYELKDSAIGSSRRRGAALMFGLTIPMFWGKIVFAVFSGLILKTDAFFVSIVTHSANVGNIISLPHQNGYLVIAPACSSFANVSLAVLCWLIFTVYSGRPRTSDDYLTCVSACINVVIVNVARISVIGLRPDLYGMLHGPVGATVASWLTAIVVLATCYFGVKREPVVGCGTDHRVSACDAAAGA